MSLRTKLLAAVVGLPLLVLVIGVAVAFLAPASSDRIPADLWALLSAVQRDPRDDYGTREEALKRLAAGPGVTDVVLIEEDSDPARTPRVVAARALAPPRSPELAEEAATLFRSARRLGVPALVPGSVALVLDGGVAPDEGQGAGPRYQGVFVRYTPLRADLDRVRALYFALVGGLALTAVAAWILLSRLVVRPLAGLAAAADRVAGGDLATRVPSTGLGDEIDRTAQAFNRMAQETAEYQGQLERRVLEALERIKSAERHLVIAQRLAATGKLASGIAHEINNPLGGMRNAVRALSRGDLDPKKHEEYLQLVQEGLSRVEETVKKVLTFTPRRAQPRPTDLVDVARKAAALARHRAERRSVTLRERFPEEPVRVFGDPSELQQVVLNLVLNALDAIPEAVAARGDRPGRVEVRVREGEEGAVLEVEDDGEGMTPEVQAQCFDLFFTTKEVGEGTGLGLAVVHHIVTNHAGRVEVDSAPGRGSRFRLVFPKDLPPEGLRPSPSLGAAHPDPVT